MKNKFRREFKWKPEFNIVNGIVIGVCLYNSQKKKDYNSAYWVAGIAILCFSFEITLSYNYKK